MNVIDCCDFQNFTHSCTELLLNLSAAIYLITLVSYIFKRLAYLLYEQESFMIRKNFVFK